MSAIYYFINTLSAESELLTFYADRINDSENGFDTAGGRTERWIGSLESLFNRSIWMGIYSLWLCT